MKDFNFELELQVRDYECDIQGIVNNAVYQNYLEHCRHKFLNFAGLVQKKQNSQVEKSLHPAHVN